MPFSLLEMIPSLTDTIVCGDIMQVVIFVVIMLFSLISQLFKEKPPGPGRAAGPRPAQPPRGNAVPPPNRNALENEIEAFLRRAIGAEEVPTVEVIEPQAANPVQPPRLEAEVYQAEPVRQGESFAQHVSQHRLAEVVEHADERMEEHLQDVFSHKLGSFDRAPLSEIAEGTDAKAWQEDDSQQSGFTGQEIRDLFRSPQEIRKAIIVNEILRRPDYKWE